MTDTMGPWSLTSGNLSKFALLRAEHAALLAHARAAVAAALRGESTPTTYLEGYLEEHGQAPSAEISPAELLAQAATCAALVDALIGESVSL